MAIVTTNNAHYNDIAAKIREKTGTENTYKPAEMPNGIEAVYEAGRLKEREGGFETVSLLTLQEQGKLTTNHVAGFNAVTENMFDVTGETTTIKISGNVEISASISASYLKILVDGNTVYEYNSENGNAADFEYTGKVKEKIEFEVFIARITFNRFAVDYAGAADKYYESGYADGVEAGQKSEYDRFWDVYQQNGNRTDYNTAFRGVGWTADNFKPKYNIVPVGNTNSMFVVSRINADLVEILEKQGVVLDFSKVTMLGSGFQNSKFTRIGEINCSSFTATGTTALFSGCTALKVIDKIVIKENIALSSWFNSCSALEEIRFEGVIGKSLDIHWSKKLSADSFKNIVEHTTTTATMTLTLPTTAEATYNAKYGAGAWAALVATRSNVEFKYA